MTGVRAAVVLAALMNSLPVGSRLALVGRQRPDLPVALWRSEGRVHEVGPEELAFSQVETRDFLAGLVPGEPSDELVADVLAATSGWPVAVYLQGAMECLPAAPAGPRGPVTHAAALGR